MAQAPLRAPLTDDDAGLVPPQLVARLRQQLPEVAGMTLDAIVADVPEYARTLTDEIRRTIQGAIGVALETFLGLLGAGPVDERQLEGARRGAYALGRGEARSGRSADALLSAYRIGARVSWQQLSATVVEAGIAADVVARFAELTFAYIDDLSAASVAGHTDELDATGRLRQQRREELARALLDRSPEGVLLELADVADWTPPATLTAVLLPTDRVHATLPTLASDTLALPSETGSNTHVLLVPDATARPRSSLLDALGGREAVVGPSRDWTDVADSLDVAVRAREHLEPDGRGVLDTGEHLTVLTVLADAGAHADLRAAVLAPLAGLPEATVARLAETLRAWLLHLGRRSDVAAALHIHPQTVRYRMDQVRDHYGDRLDDPTHVEALVVALTTTVE